jgi:hypothetical protein
MLEQRKLLCFVFLFYKKFRVNLTPQQQIECHKKERRSPYIIFFVIIVVVVVACWLLVKSIKILNYYPLVTRYITHKGMGVCVDVEGGFLMKKENGEKKVF